MILEIIDFLLVFLSSGAGTALIVFLAKDWLAVRIKASIDRGAHIDRSSFDLKRSACLDALQIVDAAYSQCEWKQGDENIKVIKQALDIAAARRAYNQLALTCTNPGVVEIYAKVLGLRNVDESPLAMTADSIVDLRNAMREELGFGRHLDFDRSKSWIATLKGAT